MKLGQLRRRLKLMLGLRNTMYFGYHINLFEKRIEHAEAIQATNTAGTETETVKRDEGEDDPYQRPAKKRKGLSIKTKEAKHTNPRGKRARKEKAEGGAS